MLIRSFLITKISGTISYSKVRNTLFTVYTNRLNGFFTTVFLLLHSHLCALLLNSLPAFHALDHITNFLQRAVCKTSSAYVLQRFCENKLAYLSFTLNFILQLHFVMCPGGNVVAVGFSSLLHLGRYFFSVPVRSCRIWIWALFFSWPGVEEGSVWLSVTEFVVPGLTADKNLASMSQSHFCQLCLDQLAKCSGESSYSVGYICSMSVGFYMQFTSLNLCDFFQCCRIHLSHAWLKYMEEK